MAKFYVIRRVYNGQVQFIGEFDKFLGMFATGGTPKEFSAINTTIRLAETLNQYISEPSEQYKVYELSTTGEEEDKPSGGKEVVEEDHEAEIEIDE